MIYHFEPIDILFFTAAIVSLLIAITAWVRRVKPGGKAFACAMFSVFLWLIFRVFEGVADTYLGKIFWAKFEYLGISTLPLFYFIFTCQYSRNDSWMNKKNLVLLSIIPLTTLILVFSNEQHHWIWADITPVMDNGIRNLIYEHAFFFWVFSIYSYSLLLVGIFSLIKTFLNFPKTYQLQVKIMIIATLLPWGGNLLYLLGLSPIQGLDLTPIGLAFSGAILIVSLYRGQILETVPVARNIIFDSMQEGIIVVDNDEIILDVNNAAVQMFKIPMEEMIKHPIKKALAAFPVLLENLSTTEDRKFEFCLDEQTQQYLQVNSSLMITDMNSAGCLVVFQDISKRKQLEIFEHGQRTFAEALARVAATLNSSLELDVILERMLDIIHEVVPHDAANIALLEGDQKMRFVKLRGYEKFRSKELIEALDYHINDIPDFLLMAQEKEAVVVSDTKTYPGWIENQGVEWIRSYIGSPIVVEDKVIGFINVDSRTPNFYNQGHAQRLKVFADEAAIAIQNARYVEELMQRNQELRSLYEVGIAMTGGLDFREVANGLFKQIENLKNIDLFIVGLFSEDNKYPIYYYDSENRSTQKTTLSPNLQNELYKLMRNVKTTVYIENFTVEDIPIEIKKLANYPIGEMHSTVNIPLLQAGEVIGIISAGNKRAAAFNEKQIRFLETIASQVAITLQNVIMYDRVKELAIIDELTGVYNRRYLYLAANKEVDRSRRYKKDLSMIIIDIDHFKEVNDHFGHLAGDKILQKITQVIQKELRGSDIFARYGGEEFLILLSDIDGKAAVKVAERIRQSVEQLRMKYMEDEISVTISLGVSSLSAERETLHDLIAASDQALYEAKQKGRNRVEYID